MSLHTLTQALPIVAAAYGRKFGVPVQVGGTQARTDGQVIYIPHLHPDAHAKLLAYGYVTHEAGHAPCVRIDVASSLRSGPPTTGA